MVRFFADGEELRADTVVLTGENAQHAKVLRLKAGETVLVCDGQGTECLCEVTDAGEMKLNVLKRRKSTSEAAVRVSVYMAFPKADKLEHVIQKATELGAYEIVAFPSARCVSRPDEKSLKKKLERWQKIAREAVKQCARVHAPEVKLPRKLSAMKEELNALDVLIVPWEDARDGSIAQCLAPFAGRESISVGILIGPEGGIAPEEAEWLVREAGAKLVTLGPRILRTETAAIASQTIVMALRGEME